MFITVDTAEETAAAALASSAARIERAGPGRWRMHHHPEGRDAPVEARLVHGWLCFEAEAPAAATRGLELLRRHAALAGPGKFALLPDQRTLRVQAELPLTDGADLHGRCRETLASLGAALAVLPGGEAGQGGAPGRTVSARDGAETGSSAAIVDICREAGWESHARSNPGSAALRTVVDLQVADGFYQAFVETEATDGLRLWVELARSASPAPASQEALALVLLRACRQLRLVRAAIEDGDDGSFSIVFEVCFELRPTALEIDHALQALATACRLCGREVRALAAAELASQFLAVRVRPA